MSIQPTGVRSAGKDTSAIIAGAKGALSGEVGGLPDENTLGNAFSIANLITALVTPKNVSVFDEGLHAKILVPNSRIASTQ